MSDGEVSEYPFFPGVNLRFHIKGDDIKAELTGPLAPIVSRLIGKGFVDHFKLYKKINRLAKRNGQFVYTLYYPPFPSKAYVKFLKTVSKWAWNMLPKAVTVAVTYACQLDCIHCSAGLYKNPSRKELSTEEIKNAINQCLRLGATNITFTGGEPLLRPDIYELISYVDRDEGVTQLFTNGLLLSKENVRRLKEAGLYSLEVSLDSSDSVEHDNLRGFKGCFKNAVEGIKNALAEGLLVGVSTYATRESVRNGVLEQLIRLSKELGVHEVSVFDVVPTGKYLSAEDLMLTDEDKRTIIRLQFKYNGESKGGFRVSTQAFQTCPLAYVPFGCFAGSNQLYITAYGDVTPCDFTPISFGNVHEESLKSIWSRIRHHPAYRNKSMRCRMQTKNFREEYINKIPDTTQLPCLVDLLPAKEGKPVLVKIQDGLFSLKTLFSLNRLRILDSLSPRTILSHRVPTKDEVMERLKMDPELFNLNLETLHRSGLIRTELYDGELYLFSNHGGLLGLFRRVLIHRFLKLISASPPSQLENPQKWRDWVSEKEIFW